MLIARCLFGINSYFFQDRLKIYHTIGYWGYICGMSLLNRVILWLTKRLDVFLGILSAGVYNYPHRINILLCCGLLIIHCVTETKKMLKGVILWLTKLYFEHI